MYKNILYIFTGYIHKKYILNYTVLAIIMVIVCILYNFSLCECRPQLIILNDIANEREVDYLST